MRVILASSSPRRKMILGGVLNFFDIIVPDVDESSLPGENPRDHAERVSALKAAESLGKAGRNGETLVIASDTIVTIGGKIIGKPADYEDAVRTIDMLNGKTHSVVTAVTIIHDNGMTRTATSSEETGVTFRKLDGEEIREYLSLVEYADKAGSYAAQEHGDKIIASIQGSMTNVIGFPLRKFFAMLVELDLAMRVFAAAK
ncbi:MAG: septum formation protein Maf [Deltaproteobacteria bacterium]|nr:MAG: septum formation protein Maf [Deltaproteobacteria bacterium]